MFKSEKMRSSVLSLLIIIVFLSVWQVATMQKSNNGDANRRYVEPSANAPICWRRLN